MSSQRPNFLRKRRSDDESSDSDGDFPPLKKQRHCNGETNIKQAFTSKCQNVLKWISDLPLKDYFKQAMFSHQATLDIVDIEDEENEVMVIPDSDDITVVSDVDSRSLNEQGRGSFLQSSLNGRPKPVSTSTPFYRDGSLVGLPHVPSMKPMNGYHSKPKTKGSSRKSQKQQRSKDQNIAPITNPSIDVEILLDSRELVGDDPDELEIVSEIPRGKRLGKFSRLAVLPVSIFNGSSNDLGAASNRSVMNGTSPSPSTSRQDMKNNTKGYTAHEVVRLQEKAQYKLLLDKIVKNSIYRPVKSRETAAIEVDLTADEPEESVGGSHYHKELLQQPVVEFIEKYYHPCNLISKPKKVQVEKISMTYEDDQPEVFPPALPEYRPRIKAKPDFFSADWIRELKSSINEETEKRLEIVRQQEQKIKRYRDRRDAKYQEEKQLFEKYKVPGDVFVEISGEHNDYPALTPEMENLIHTAMKKFNGSENDHLSTFNGVTVTRKHLLTLIDGNWLIDEVLNFYLNLIVERSKQEDYPSVYAYSTFFYTSLKSRGIQSVLRWTRKVDIFSYDIIFVPLHLGVHWALCVIDNRSRKIQYYDSMGSSEDHSVFTIHEYLAAEKKAKKNQILEADEYILEVVRDLPNQMNGSDCGMFTLKYAEYISRDAPITFEQAHMIYFRRRMMYEILSKQLL